MTAMPAESHTGTTKAVSYTHLDVYKRQALGTYYIGRKKPVLGPVFPILANMIIVPLVLQYVYGAPDSYWYLMVTVGLGEIVCCGLLGGRLYKAYKRAV